MTTSHIVKADELDWNHTKVGEHFECFRKALGREAGAQKIGCSLHRVPPGKRAWPKHAHYVNEESLYILAGTGVAQIGDTQQAVSAGDYVVYPAGAAYAHQLEATGSEDLLYLCFSTMEAPDVVHYPDSKKIGVMVGSAPGGDPQKRQITAYFEQGSDVPYWQGET